MPKKSTTSTPKKTTNADKQLKALESRVEKLESQISQISDHSVPNLDSSCMAAGWCGQFFQFLRVNPVSGVCVVLVAGILLGLIFG